MSEETDKIKENDHEEVELTPTEEKALELGWVPKEEWEGPEDQWVDAREFLFRGELMGKIHSQGRTLQTYAQQIDSLKKALKELGEHNKKIAETEYKKALRQLRAELREAEANEEYDVAEELEEKIDELREAKKSLEKDDLEDDTSTKTVQPEVPPEVIEWQSKNDWYEKDTMMRAAANAAALEYRQMNPNATVKEHLAYIDKKIREAFPHKFGKTSPPPMGGKSNSGGRKVRGKSKYTVDDLNDMQRSLAKSLVESGAFKDVQEYVDQLAELGEIG